MLFLFLVSLIYILTYVVLIPLFIHSETKFEFEIQVQVRMPPRASVTRKKSRPELQYDELQRALLERVAAHPSAEQPSAQQQGFAQPSHSLVLPLVLPTPSINSTSDSTASTTTGASLFPVRNIRSRNAVVEATVSST